MKIVGISQRVVSAAEYAERRDALDQRWAALFEQCGLLPLPLPNRPTLVHNILDHVRLDGIVLSGGNTLVEYGGDAPERDETERLLLQYAIGHDLPLLGVCRGLQVIQTAFGVPLQPVTGHVAVEHAVRADGSERNVNSFHRLGATLSPEPLEAWAVAADGVIEAVRHRDKLILGLMWHPERCSPFDPRDVSLIRRCFSGRADNGKGTS